VKEIVVADIGGTHVRFAIAEVAEGKVAKLSDAVTLETADYASLQRAWTAFAEQAGRKLPDAVAISFAGPVHGEVLKLTNNPWVIRRAEIPASLGVTDWTLINDFSAVGHATVHMDSDNLFHLCGPDIALPTEGVISVIGPGTGLGVAHVLRHGSRYWVNETEGGHIDFAPLDALEDRIVAQLRKRYRRVSAERVVSGPGLNNIYEVLRGREGGAHRSYEDADLWTAALDGTDSLAVAAHGPLLPQPGRRRGRHRAGSRRQRRRDRRRASGCAWSMCWENRASTQRFIGQGALRELHGEDYR
jgi:glucokinase